MFQRLFWIGALAAVVLTVLAAPAAADPPLGTNPNATAFTFDCGTQGTFDVISIGQNAASAAQLVDGTGTLIFKKVTVNGTVVYEAPGWADKPTSSCSIVGVPGVVFEIVFMPQR
jgi:hypothetical protein